MLGKIQYTIDDKPPVVVEPSYGDMVALEREFNQSAAEIPEVTCTLWLAWRCAKRTGVDPSAKGRFQDWADRITDFDVPEDASDPTQAGDDD